MNQVLIFLIDHVFHSMFTLMKPLDNWLIFDDVVLDYFDDARSLACW